MANNHFHFKDFKPPNDLELNADIMLSQLIDFAALPLDVSAVLERVGQKYSCCVEIKSLEVSFCDKIVCDEPSAAIDEIDQKLRGQILKWQAKHKIESSPVGPFSPFETQEL